MRHSFGKMQNCCEGVYGELDMEDYRAGKIAPVFFGSAVNNFGVQASCWTPLYRSRRIRLAAIPISALSHQTRKNLPASSLRFTPTWTRATATALPFCACAPGVLQRNTYYKHTRLEKDVRFSNPYSFLAREKDVIEEAFPGDVVGLFDTGNFKIGDTLTQGEVLQFTGIPTFSPEIFKELVNKDPMKTKQLEKGIQPAN